VAKRKRKPRTASANLSVDSADDASLEKSVDLSVQAETTFQTPKGPGPHAEVYVTVGATHFPKKYKPVKVSIGGSVPCRPEDMTATAKTLVGWCKGLVRDEIVEIVNETKKRRAAAEQAASEGREKQEASRRDAERAKAQQGEI